MAMPEDSSMEVPVNLAVDCVVRNAMEKLVEKQADLRNKSFQRKKELAKYFEETRRQLISLLALVRWQKKRLKVTKQCDDLIENLRLHHWHMHTTSERLCIASEELAYQHRTPMYDMRTAVDVLASGTYNGLPDMEMQKIITPKVTDAEKEQVIKRLDFLIRTELLNMKIPADLSKVEVKDGRLTLQADDEFELVLSLRLDQSPHPFKVDKVQLLVKAQGGPLPACDGLVPLIENRMMHNQEPLVEAVTILGDCARFRTWQILNSQAQGPLFSPKVDVETSTNGNSFTVYYWQDSQAPVSFESLMTSAVRKNTVETKANVSADSRIKIKNPCIIFMSTKEGHSRVQIKHSPPLVDEDGKIVEIHVNRSSLSLESVIQDVLKLHSSCRLRLLHKRLSEYECLLRDCDIAVTMTPTGNELVVHVEGKPRVSIVSDYKSGELEARDLLLTDSAPTYEKLQTGLHRALLRTGDDSVAQVLIAWRSYDILNIVTGLAPSFGLKPAFKLLTYSHSQSIQLNDLVNEKKPGIFLQLPGCSILDSGYKDPSKPLPKPSSQDVWALMVQYDAYEGKFHFSLLILSVSKGAKPVIEKLDVDKIPLQSWPPASSQNQEPRTKKRKVTGPIETSSVEKIARIQLAKVSEIVSKRIRFMQLEKQLDMQRIKWRSVGDVILLHLHASLLQSRELRLYLEPKSASFVAGGCSGWKAEMTITTSYHEHYKHPSEILPTIKRVGFLEEVVEEGGSNTLTLNFPNIHCESIRMLQQIVQGLSHIARLAHRIMEIFDPAHSEEYKDLQGTLAIEAMGHTCIVLRMIESRQLISIRYRLRGGFAVSIGNEVHPLTGNAEIALDSEQDIVDILTSIVSMQVLLDIVKELPTNPGDVTLFSHHLDGLCVIFRGMFGFYIRYTDIYSISDATVCTPRFASKGMVEQDEWSYKFPPTSFSSFMDTIWPIPDWQNVISFIVDHITALDYNSLLAEGQNVLVPEREQGYLPPIPHFTGKSSSLVCSRAHVQKTIELAYQHIVVSFMHIYGNWLISKVNTSTTNRIAPAPPAQSAPPAPPAHPASAPSTFIVRGRHIFSLELTQKGMPQWNGVEKLRLKVENAGAAAEKTKETLTDADVKTIESIFEEAINESCSMNRLRSFLNLLSFPVAVIHSFCEIWREISIMYKQVAEVALAPVFLVDTAETKEKVAAGIRKGALTPSPRSDSVSCILHDNTKDEATFVLRLWMNETPAVEVQLIYAYTQSKMFSGTITVLPVGSSREASATEMAETILKLTANPTPVPAGQLWSSVKNILGQFQAPPPPAPAI
uniref:Mediator of RNA polymerase II transcription subunit 14 n=1 Tax=Guillardia theta TaxID=55529 RepID=A0A7S4NTL8_GUITH